jgi:nitrous oxide reductase
MSRVAKHVAQARRSILGALGLATGAAVVAPAAAALEASGSTAGLAPAKENEAEKRKPRYRETDHVKAFYRTNRY